METRFSSAPKERWRVTTRAVMGLPGMGAIISPYIE
jgi:hypothetical protein